MNRREFVAVMVLAFVLGAGVTLLLNGSNMFTPGQSAEAVDASVATYTTGPLKESLAPLSTPMNTNSPTEPSPTATPTRIPMQVGIEKGEDLADVLLLHGSTRLSNSDINFCKIAEYYGLLCKKVALDTMDLTDELLRDGQGNYLRLVGIDASALLRTPSLLTNEELTIIRSAVETGGVNLLVSKVNDGLDPTVLVELTDGAVSGVTDPQDSRRDWFVSSAAPEMTREFTDQTISSTSTASQSDFALILGQKISVTTLISSKDDVGMAYPIFVRCEKSAGSIFIDAGEEGESLEVVPLRETYYNYEFYHFSKIVPLMFTMRYVLGNEAWHNDHNYANLIIDDPALTEPWDNLSYAELLREMKMHNFHTTIAMSPRTWSMSEPAVVALFRADPDRYSLVQHGNNGDGYEFYKYSVAEDDEYQGMKLPARPFADQEADIVEGLARMAKHRSLTGIPDDRVMIFPWGISPEPTLVLLKKYNFLATINGQDVPLGATRPSDWDYGMYQANMDYGNFPMLTRRYIATYETFRPRLQSFILDLFVDKPALFFSHTYEGELFGTGRMDAFDPIADQVNAVSGGVEWRSLGHIIKHLYLEKTNDDGSVAVRMYGNHLIVTNESGEERTYHIAKEEALNVPISLLTVNGHEFPYRVEGGLLTLDMSVPADSTFEILIRYKG